MTNQPSATWGPEFPAIFDRQSKKLTARSFKAWLQVRCIQVSSKALAPVGYVGISRVHGAINALLRPSGDTLIIDKESLFRFPANDYYWNRLLDIAWHYEPEIDRFLSEHSEVPFVFVDLGANFGFWSSRVAQGEFGAHHVIAVEPADSCLDVLHRNIVGHGSPVIVHKRIIDETSGVPRQLFGSRHAGFSVDSHWSGASDTCVNEALTLSVDDLFDEATAGDAATPVVFKVDVEGAELSALKGATQAIDGATIFIMEDAAAGSVAPATRYAVEELGMRLYAMRDGGMRSLSGWQEVLSMRTSASRIQVTGLNLFVTRSPFWIQRLDLESTG